MSVPACDIDSRNAGTRRPPPELARPHVRLHGQVDDSMLSAFLEGLAQVEENDGPLVLELTTVGGDAEVGRRIASDVRQFRARTGRATIFHGKASVYSAGVTIMSGFRPGERWLTEDCMLLIHCRRLDKTLALKGSLNAERAKVEAVLAEIDAGLQLQAYDFRSLVQDTGVGLDELLQRAEHDWYVAASEAVRRGLVAGLT